MTVDQFIAKLAAFPGDWEVVVDQSIGLYYPVYAPMKDPVQGYLSGWNETGDRGKFKKKKREYDKANCVCIGYQPGCVP